LAGFHDILRGVVTTYKRKAATIMEIIAVIIALLARKIWAAGAVFPPPGPPYKPEHKYM
jgi:hypothetical protein